MAMLDLTCQELVELVTDYLDDALTAAARARFEAHIVDCPYCDIYLDQMQRTIRLVGGIRPERPITPEAEAELLERFRAWKEG